MREKMMKPNRLLSLTLAVSLLLGLCPVLMPTADAAGDALDTTTDHIGQYVSVEMGKGSVGNTIAAIPVNVMNGSNNYGNSANITVGAGKTGDRTGTAVIGEKKYEIYDEKYIYPSGDKDDSGVYTQVNKGGNKLTVDGSDYIIGTSPFQTGGDGIVRDANGFAVENTTTGRILGKDGTIVTMASLVKGETTKPAEDYVWGDLMSSSGSPNSTYNAFQLFGSKKVETTGKPAGMAPGFDVAGFGQGNPDYYILGINDQSSNRGYDFTAACVSTDREDRSGTLTIRVDDNPTLKTLAAGGGLEMYFTGILDSSFWDAWWALTEEHEDSYCEVSIYPKGSSTRESVAYMSTLGGEGNSERIATGWVSINPGDTIEIWFRTEGTVDDYVGMEDVFLGFRDTTCPVLNDYSLLTNGAYYYNTNSSTPQVLLKQFEVSTDDELYDGTGGSDFLPGYMNLDFSFSEPVSANLGLGAIPDDKSLLDQLANHVLFYNTLGTGFERQGDPVYLRMVGTTLYDKTESFFADYEQKQHFDENNKLSALQAFQYEALYNKDNYFTDLHYQWQARTGDYFGNNPVLGSGDWYGVSNQSNEYSLLSKMFLASLHDAAGNPLKVKTADNEIKTVSHTDTESTDGTIVGDIKVNDEPANILAGDIQFKDPFSENISKTVTSSQSPFSELKVIIDAVAPTYSVSSNGIQPDILTQLALNDGDEITFKVNFSEPAQLRRYQGDNYTLTGWDASGTYLEFNNGMKAYLTNNDNAKQWIFKMEIDSADNLTTLLEIKTLEVTKLAHDSHTSDTFVITDYVGNPLIQAAGVEANRSSIAWADLTIDNTPPQFSFVLAQEGGTNPTWQLSNGVTVTAADPELKSGGTGSGIYAPANTSGGDPEPSGGLFYYTWVKGSGETGSAQIDGVSITDTDTAVLGVLNDLTVGNYKNVKRYSLAAIQPDGYTGNNTVPNALLLLNNGQQLTTPAAMQSAENSGEWYLVTFTADMTWDSARQLVQYNNVKTFQTANAGTYLDYVRTYYTENPPSDPDIPFEIWYELGNELGLNIPENGTYAASPAEGLVTVTKPTYAYLLGSGLTVKIATNYTYYNDGVFYANTEVMKDSANYGNWDLNSTYAADDSNWSWAVQQVKLDNAMPYLTERAGKEVAEGGTPVYSGAEATYAEITNDNTSNVTVTFTLADDHSGLKSVKYAYVAAGDPVSAATFDEGKAIDVTDGSLTKEITLKTQDYGAGSLTMLNNELDLYVLVADMLNNGGEQDAYQILKVATLTTDHSNEAYSGFNLETNVGDDAVPPYQALDANALTFYALGLQYGEEVGITEVKYQIVESGTAIDKSDASWGSAAALTYSEADTSKTFETAAGEMKTARAYPFPALSGRTGEYTIVVRAAYYMESDVNGVYENVYYVDSLTLEFDKDAPQGSYTPADQGSAQLSARVTISVQDDYALDTVEYLWLAEDATAPALETMDGFDWISFDTVSGRTADQIVSASGESLGLEPGTQGTFKLYTYAKDKTGNAQIIASGDFVLYAPQVVEAPVAEGDLLTVWYNEETGTNQAVLEVLLPDGAPNPTGDFAGYKYSTALVTTGGELVWSRWKPYESMIVVDLGAGSYAGNQVWVKFQSPTGVTNTEDEFVKKTLTAPVGGNWTYATRDLLKKLPAPTVENGVAVQVELTLPEGTEVKDVIGYKKFSDFDDYTNPANEEQDTLAIAPAGEANRYKVTGNGFYAFVIGAADSAEPTENAVYYMVIDNFDTEAPIGSLTYTTTNPTGGNVTAMLDANEEIAVTKIEFTPANPLSSPMTKTDGRASFTFEENGAATFFFEDEAGNQSRVTANVSWIDKRMPEVVVHEGFEYKDTSGKQQTLAHVKDGNGVIRIAKGAILTLNANDERNYQVLAGADKLGGKTASARENGTYSFTVRDDLDNRTIIDKEIAYIINSIEAPETIASKFIQVDGNGEYVSDVTGVCSALDGKYYAGGEDVRVLVTVSGEVVGGQYNDYYFSPAKSPNTLMTKQQSRGQYLYSYSRMYSANGTTNAYMSDELGNSVKFPIEITGLDSIAPAISFQSIVTVEEGMAHSGIPAYIAGLTETYTVSDNAFDPAQCTVTVTLGDTFDSTLIKSQLVTYTVTDPVGNSSTANRYVYIMPEGGLVVDGNGILFYAGSSDVAIVDDNTIQLTVRNYDLMTYFVGDEDYAVQNTRATYNAYVQSGLYREGQMKYVGEITTNGDHAEVSTIELNVSDLPGPGWYTIIVRNQEREREYTTFFISAVSQ